jgi:hypothetical protein
MTAGRRGKDYRIAGSETRHARANALDDARAFMAEHDRMRHRIDDVVAHRNVGMANAGGDQPDQHFVARGSASETSSRLSGAFLARATAAVICMGGSCPEALPEMSAVSSLGRSQMAQRPRDK